MTNSGALYDTPSREIYLLENVAIQGRKTELRQLLKLLNLAKTGQPKAALITGDSGIGKSALLDAFVQLVHEGVYCRVIQLGTMHYESPEALYVAFITELQAEANRILDDALIAVNEITQELDLKWERQDLVRATALVKLQESIGGKQAISQEQLVKAIRSQVPAVKKLKFSVNESIQKLVDLIVNPWIMAATSLLNPINPALQSAIRLADTLRDNQYQWPNDPEIQALLNDTAPSVSTSEVVDTLYTPPTPPSPVVKEPYREPVREPEKAPERTVDRLYGGGGLVDGIVSLPRPVRKKETTEDQTPSTSKPAIVDDAVLELGENLPDSSRTEPTSRNVSSSTQSTSQSLTPVSRIEAPVKPIRDPLIKHLMNVLNFINSTIKHLDSGLLIALDEWDRILGQPKQEELKNFLTELIYQITEQKNYHYMVAMTARTEGESYTLGGNLYNHFRTKLLLEPLSDAACRRIVKKQLQEAGVDLEEGVHDQIFKLSYGNPFWHLRIFNYLKERVEGTRLSFVDLSFFEKLGLKHRKELLDLSFTRLKLSFLHDEESLFKVIAALMKHFSEQVFSANQAIREISTSQGFTEDYVFEVLRALYRHDFIRAASGPKTEPLKDDGPFYTLHSRDTLQFLSEKTRAIQTDISTDEKLLYLKKVIPLSVRSGDLDREKTKEVLALGHAMGNQDIVHFLEDTFIDCLQNEQAVVRVTALNNIALIDSEKAREALFIALKDDNSMVREFAAQNLALLSQKSAELSAQGQYGLVDRILDAMIESIDDESEAVRAQIYATLSRYRTYRDMGSVFVKGMSDACEGVRLVSIRNLSDIESDSPYLFNTFIDALQDPAYDIRRYACIGLQRYSTPEAIDALMKVLQKDPDSSLRALAADSLSRMDDKRAFSALIVALRHEASEDVKLAVARALGKRRGWQSEALLQESLQSADYEAMPVFVWACVRSLGQVGGTERSRDLLLSLQRKISNTIIQNAIHFAVQKLNERIEELKQMERQLEEATPLTVATPSEYDEEVHLPEEELPSDLEQLAHAGPRGESGGESHSESEEALIALAREALGEPVEIEMIPSAPNSTEIAQEEAIPVGHLTPQSTPKRGRSLLKLPFER